MTTGVIGLIRTAAKVVVPSGIAAGLAIAGAHSALAVSGGGYDPERQGCTKTADRNDVNAAQPGCHNLTMQVTMGDTTGPRAYRLITINTDQTALNQNVHSGSVIVDPGRGTALTVAFDSGAGGIFAWTQALGAWLSHPKGAPPAPALQTPTVTAKQAPSTGRLDPAQITRLGFYLGADDNLDFGEHDGVNPDHGTDRPVANGPSDGGAIQASTHPTSSPTDNVNPTDTHDPVRAADSTAGACADGLCFGYDTMRRTYYKGGCTSCSPQAVYDDENTTDWRSPNCNSGDANSQDHCGSGWQTGSDQGSISGAYDQRGSYYSDPGVFIYEDPDPQASPLLPMYPICELYAGTQGVKVCTNEVGPATRTSPPAAPTPLAVTSTPAGVLQPAAPGTLPTSTPAVAGGLSRR